MAPSHKGLSQYEIEIKSTDSYQKEGESFDVKLRKLKILKDEGILSDKEYEMKREEIIRVRIKCDLSSISNSGPEEVRKIIW